MNYGKSRLFALAAAHGASLLAVPAVLQAQDDVGPARGSRGHGAPARGEHPGRSGHDHRIHGDRDPQCRHPSARGLHRADAGRVGGADGRGRRHAGQHPRHQHRPRRRSRTSRWSSTACCRPIRTRSTRNSANVTQIEVLKGPQGALYGRNAVAGAFIVTTRKPGEELEAEVRAGYGTQNTYDASLYVGGPISGTVRGSIGAYTRSTDGFYDNSFLDCDDCVDTFSEDGFNGRLLFDVGGGEMDFKAKYSQIELGRDQLQCVAGAGRRGSVPERPVVLREPEQPEVPATSTTSSRRTSRRTSTSRCAATGTSRSPRSRATWPTTTSRTTS